MYDYVSTCPKITKENNHLGNIIMQKSQQFNNNDVKIKNPPTLNIHSFFIIVTLLLLTALLLILGMYYLVDNMALQSKTHQYLCSASEQLTWCLKS